MTTNFDNTGEATLGNTDVSALVTYCDKTTMVTDAEYDVLWEANKRRFYVHQAWPNLFVEKNPDGTVPRYTCTDEADAKVKLKLYLDDFLTGPTKDVVDTYYVRVYEGSDIRALYLLVSIKLKNGDGYIVEKDSDIQKIWEANGQTGDYRDNTVVTDLSLSLLLSTGVKSSAWYYSWMTQNSHFEAIHTALKADGYEKVLNQLTGQVQKKWAVDVFNMMKDMLEDGGSIARGKYAGQNTEATPVFNYVDDNTTSAYSFALQHQHPNYADLPAEIKPCGWPFTTVKIDGKYPPFD